MASTTSSLLILGTDTVTGAAPCTAVQLMHACLAAGFEAVVPASWGDELVAGRVLEKMKAIGGPAVQCSCPLVASRLATHGDAIAPMLICTVPPPVATAEYLRALYAPGRPAITYAGGCSGAASDAIDTWMSAQDLFQLLAERGVTLAEQPTEFDALPPDRRRFHSEPGGMPARTSLRQLHPAAQGIELDSHDFVAAMAQHLLGGEPVLVDVAAALGCACAGAGHGVNGFIARARVREHEPPRAPSPVVDHRVPVTLDAELPRAREPAAQARPAGQPPAPPSTDPSPVAVAVETPRRRSPVGLPRPVLGTAPRNSRPDAVGRRSLPRAYVARRRSSPRGMKTVDPASRERAGLSPRHTRLLWLGAGVIGGALLTWLARLAF